MKASPLFCKLKYHERKKKSNAGEEQRDKTQVGPRLKDSTVDYRLEENVSTIDKMPIIEVEKMVPDKGILTPKEVDQVASERMDGYIGSELSNEDGSGQQSSKPSLRRRWVRKARANQIWGNEINQKIEEAKKREVLTYEGEENRRNKQREDVVDNEEVLSTQRIESTLGGISGQNDLCYINAEVVTCLKVSPEVDEKSS
ncbi:hypothetical protein QYF36_004726 [Acer negundo]|nr:hypothetical protein QYF36_004726 [Acer negundo]